MYVTQLRCVQLLNFYDYHTHNLMILITLSTITGNVKGTQIIINAAQRTDPRHFSIFDRVVPFGF